MLEGMRKVGGGEGEEKLSGKLRGLYSVLEDRDIKRKGYY